MICKKCGAVLDDSANFCNKCGNAVSSREAPKEPKREPYIVLQVTLKEKFLGTGSGNLYELQNVINRQAALGYRLHTISTTSAASKGLGGGDRIQATMVFERI